MVVVLEGYMLQMENRTLWLRRWCCGWQGREAHKTKTTDQLQHHGNNVLLVEGPPDEIMD